MIQEIAKRTKTQENEVRDVISHFFKETKNAISYGDRPIVRTPFGSFIVRGRALEYYLMNRIKFYRENKDAKNERNKEKLLKLLRIRRKWKKYLISKRKQYKPNGT